jgi:uncharacterized protein
MGKIRLLVLDVLKPHNPTIIELSNSISDLPHIDGVDITVYEIDSKVENVKITIKGSKIDYETIKKAIEDLGATVHSIDKVSSGNELVEEAHTHQDSPN